eukprot:TRINITY_DN33274_c0_g1_i1.p1 TRINITY_DN33274_c0_g1~~TRINITY_DN33274_c0_g1_i1.p1  ORF type:complete len:215 (-),score=29.98 TRINITY_DN33274_c0_g1_i1:86-730(-)
MRSYLSTKQSMESRHSFPVAGLLYPSAECQGAKITSVHLLPCCIQHNDAAPVDEFFRPKDSDLSVEGNAVKEASFRGRKLVGAALALPEGFSGLVFAKMPSEGLRDGENGGAASGPNGRVGKRGRRRVEADSSNLDGSGERDGSGQTPVDSWRAEAAFGEMKFWQRDSCPTPMALPRRCLEWLQVSKEMHSPVSTEAVESQLQEMEKNSRSQVT